MQNKEHDNAVKIMMERATTWKNDLFLDAIIKVCNAEIMYKAEGY
jgi:hypothetical protein